MVVLECGDDRRPAGLGLRLCSFRRLWAWGDTATPGIAVSEWLACVLELCRLKRWSVWTAVPFHALLQSVAGLAHGTVTLQVVVSVGTTATPRTASSEWLACVLEFAGSSAGLCGQQCHSTHCS